MDKGFRDLLAYYIAIVTSSSIVTSLKLLSIFLNAYKRSDKLKYSKSDISLDSKIELFSIFSICLSDIGAYIFKCARLNIIGIYDAYEFEEDFYREYLEYINDKITDININEEKDREKFKDLINRIQEKYPGYLDEDEFEDLITDINVYKLQKFLRKHDIMIKKVSDNTDEIKFRLKNENRD